MMAPGWYQRLGAPGRQAFWTSFAGFCLAAMSLQLYAFILPVLMQSWQISTEKAGLLASAALLAGSIGGWAAGALSDRLGRVRLLRIAILWVGCASALCGLAHTYEQLLAARLLQGVGFGAEWAVGIVFISETTVPAVRARTIGSLQSAWAVGWGLAATIAALALAVLPQDISWRLTFFVGLLPAILLVMARSRLHEPPVFADNRTRTAWHGIFERAVLPSTVKGSLLATGAHGGYWAIATWWPTMLLFERGLPRGSIAIHSTCLITGAFFGYHLGASLSDRIGRRQTLLLFAAAAISIVLVATLLPISDNALLALTPLLGLFSIGMYSAVGAALTELYPTSLRGSGMGFCYNVGRGIAGVTPLAVGGSVALLGYSHAIGIYVAASYGLVMLVTVTVRETRGIDFSNHIEPETAALDRGSLSVRFRAR